MGKGHCGLFLKATVIHVPALSHVVNCRSSVEMCKIRGFKGSGDSNSDLQGYDSV
jgi:hypothetical protein